MKKTLLIALLSSVTFIGACGKGGGASSAAVSSSDDYKTRGMDMIAKMVDVFKETDCDKLAANISGFIDNNKGAIDALKAWEKDHKDDKKAGDKAAEDKMKDFMGTVGPIMEKCKGNKALEDAMKKMPD